MAWLYTNSQNLSKKTASFSFFLLQKSFFFFFLNEEKRTSSSIKTIYDINITILGFWDTFIIYSLLHIFRATKEKYIYYLNYKVFYKINLQEYYKRLKFVLWVLHFSCTQQIYVSLMHKYLIFLISYDNNIVL